MIRCGQRSPLFNLGQYQKMTNIIQKLKQLPTLKQQYTDENKRDRRKEWVELSEVIKIVEEYDTETTNKKI